jgi:aromatic ring hydroxylase
LKLLTQPLTGSEYLESLRDGREVYIDGERVADVTAHPAFRNAARSVARLYDALHDPALRDVLTAIAAWARFSYGSMGRTPDHKANRKGGAGPRS